MKSLYKHNKNLEKEIERLNLKIKLLLKTQKVDKEEINRLKEIIRRMNDE